MAERELSLGLCLLLIISFADITSSEVLTPPYFNLVYNRNISASSTCGVGVAEPELFCRLTGATGAERGFVDTSKEIIQGQYCDVCDPDDHPVDYAIDGTNRWWQSPPLSRGMRYNEVNLTVNLGQEFHVAYVFIKMANSPRPGVWALERSTDFGQTWLPWQYFADTPSDCYKFFNAVADKEIVGDDDVICATEFSKIVPLENGEIVVSLVNNRPSAMNFSYATTLQDWTKATNVRLRLLRTKTLLGHLMAVARQDPTVTRRYFYSIKDISIGGRCVCNGHADTCDRDVSNPTHLICACQHNTCGSQCDQCCPQFVQKKWQPARADKIFMCEPCQCYGHTTECVYDEEVDQQNLSIDIYGKYDGGGKCLNCQHNTYGVNCEKCVSGFYRPYGVPRNATDACRPCRCDLNVSTGECEEGTGRCLCRPEYTGELCDSCSPGYTGYPKCVPCDCHINGTEYGICSVNGGQCPCKENYVGSRCDMCAFGFYNFPECAPCQCKAPGSVSNKCDVESGQCPCNPNFAGQDCTQCADGFFDFPTCSLCDCEPSGTESQICNKTSGECICKPNFQYPRCDRCSSEYYNYPVCQECQCAVEGSLEKVCREDGQCPCRGNFGGRTCGRCSPGYFRYPSCTPCRCDPYGSYGQSCDQVTGQCQCRPTFQGLQCSKCKEGFYNYPMCEDCNCNPAGAKEVPGYPLGGCGEVIKGRLCECKERVMGRICDKCMPGYYNLNRNNPFGCDECQCYAPGTVSGLDSCNPTSGQCMCKVDVSGRRCDTCRDGFYGLSESNPFGCVECNCDLGGSYSPTCEKRLGQCPCKPRVRGRRCEFPDTMHFFPTLQQFIYELEDGFTPEGSRIRYGFDTFSFPNFSWRGYAILTAIQPEVVMDVTITKPSLYRLIYRFVNVNDQNVKGEVTLKPQSQSDVTQMSEVYFPPSTNPKFITVGTSGSQHDFVLNPGSWMISIKTSDIMLLDYMVLVPQAYYEATVLQKRITRPCTIPQDMGPCIVYNYPDINEFPKVDGEDGFIVDGNQSQIPTQLFTDKFILSELGLPALAKLDKNQRDLNLNLVVPNPGLYVLVFNYFAQSNRTQTLDVVVRTPGEDTQGTVLLYNCQYSVLCRQVMKDNNNMPSVINITNTAEIILNGDADVDVALGSVVAIPYDQWILGFIRPSIICIRINGICVGSSYSVPVGSTRIDFEDPPNAHRRIDNEDLPTAIIDRNTGLVLLNETYPDIVIEGTVQDPTQYIVFVHFYLPTEAGVDIPVNIHTSDGQVIKGTFRPRFCPSVSGCRGQIYIDGTNNNILNLREGDIKFVFNNTAGKDIYLDYVMMVPARQFSPTDLNLQPIDNSANFLTQCIGPGFELINNSSFCENGVYTLTTDFNNGAIPCGCDTDGSLSFDCDNFGGQCSCRDNVIGRKCTHCREGYFGFPRCKPCDCPYGMCHPVSGDCMCPPLVTGEKCNQCMPATYGYDPLVGCTDCKCNPDGVVSGDMNCDQSTGQCLCLPNIGGRKCDYCKAGYHTYPLCYECGNCNRKGTKENICNVLDGTCTCKENVAAPDCDKCEPGNFFLDPENPKGCTRCFCFGITTKCDSSSLVWEETQDMSGWGITNTADGKVREATDTIAVLEIDTKIVDPLEPMYWVVPPAYLGDKICTLHKESKELLSLWFNGIFATATPRGSKGMVLSYGGRIKYNLLYLTSRDENVTITQIYRPDVVIVGSNITLHYAQPFSPAADAMTGLEFELLEYNFVNAEDGVQVSRETFMLVLVDLQAIHILASYATPVTQIRLMKFRMDVATEKKEDENSGGFWSLFGGSSSDDEDTAFAVESCTCPPGYTGTSCQNCAQGYYRSQSSAFTYLGVCLPCNCHGHSDSCDVQTGQCLACRDNTMGKHCEMCVPGYHGDATTGNCEICSCPLPISSNNFASGCQVYNGQVLSCDCEPGYAGALCDRCAPGHFGNPNVEGDICRRCQCSGNIDISDPESCSASTGDCIKCLNNTRGPNCAHCSEWWYGDAVVAKNCRSCNCDRCGASSCDGIFGNCTCKPNVIGTTCDRCAPDTYGFNACQGCQVCDCGMGSNSTQCHETTGSCFCQPGVTGQKCDNCIEGFWNYSRSGCQECECEDDGAITCDRVTGKCQCLPGVTGARCDRCLPRWILVPQEGCKPCDSCIHILLDDVEVLNRNISSLSNNLATVSVGVTANKRLNDIKEDVMRLTPEVDALLKGSQNISLTDLQNDLAEVESLGNTGEMESDALVRKGDIIVTEASTLAESANTIEDSAMEMHDIASDVAKYATGIYNRILDNIQVTNVNTFINQSNQVLEEIMNRNFTKSKDRTVDEDLLARETLGRITLLQSVGMDHTSNKDVVFAGIEDIMARLYNLQLNQRNSDHNSADAENIIDDLKMSSLNILKVRQDSIVSSYKDTEMLMAMSEDNLENARIALNNSKLASFECEKTASRLDMAIISLRDNVGNLTQDLTTADEKLNNSKMHAESLVKKAELLENVYTDTREIAGNALDAARAYQVIVNAISEAHNASTTAVDAALEALGKSNGVGNNTSESKDKSMALYKIALQKFDITEQALAERLTDAKTATDEVDNSNNDVQAGIDELRIRLKGLPLGVVETKATDAAKIADDAAETSRAAQGRVQEIVNKQPDDRLKIELLAQSVSKTTSYTDDSNRQTAYVKGELPVIVNMIQLIGKKSKVVSDLNDGVKANLTRLREQIALARDEANRIRVGLEFLGNTSVTLRNPDNVDQAGSYARMSMFIQTRETDALLAYVGAEMFPSRPAPDYMALELKNGKPVFKFNLGSGMAEVTSVRDVSDGNWYKLTAERIGKAGTLRVEGDPGKGIFPTIAKSESPGTYTVLELNPLTTKFFFGGIPSTAMLPPNISRSFYEGVIEDVAFDDRPMGLWNFIGGENNYQGAIERDVLKSVVSNGFQFNGNGYVVLSAKQINFNPTAEAYINLRFKTYAENGLILFMGKDRDFTSIEIVDGKILYQYDLGGMPAKLMSNKTYNDGKWHNVEVSRNLRDGSLRINGKQVVDGTSPGVQKEMGYTDDIYIGGYSSTLVPIDYVKSKGFDGCIEDVQFETNKWDLNKNKGAKNVVPGCPTKILRTATFSAERPGYIAVTADSIGENFDMTFKMKTRGNNSLVVYTASKDQTSGFSVAVVNGRIVVTSEPGADATVIESAVNTYNNGRWHYVSVMKMGTKLMMNIDDQEMVNKMGRFSATVLTERDLYFGGTDFTVTENLVGSTKQFVGCIADVTINGRFLNFASIPSSKLQDVSFSECTVESADLPQGPGKIDETTLAPDFTTMTPKSCALPSLVQLSGVDPGVTVGDYFGTTPTSRYQYRSLGKSLQLRFSIKLEMKTTSSAGVMLYSGDKKHYDFVALYMRAGKVVFSFNCGTGAAVIETSKTYNDGKWHTIEFSRESRSGTLVVDSDETLTGESKGRTMSISTRPPIYLGGLRPDVQTIKRLKSNLKGITDGFVGCMRNYTFFGKPFMQPVETFDVKKCSQNLEIGTFFNDLGGYIQLYEKYSVGLDLKFKIEIKPRNTSGILLAIHNNNADFMILQMDKGKIIFKADNGRGEFSTMYEPPNDVALCDGQWHTIEANKAKNVLLLSVDGVPATPGTGAEGSSEINSNDPLYIGGLPDYNRRGVVIKRNYSGCMRNLEIMKNKETVYKPQYLSTGQRFGDVYYNTCPVV